MGVASPVSEILLLFFCLQKWPNFPFGPWIIVHGGQKIELAQKFMQVEVDMKCMQTNLGGCSLFRDIANFLLFSKMAKFPFRTMDYSLWGLKNIEIYPIIFTKIYFIVHNKIA